MSEIEWQITDYEFMSETMQHVTDNGFTTENGFTSCGGTTSSVDKWGKITKKNFISVNKLP